MARLKRPDRGFTLLELIIAITLSAIVFLSASNLLINFGRFSSNVVKSEESLIGTALGAFEEIVREINSANKVAINPAAPMDIPATAYPAGCAAVSCIQIRVDPIGSNSASDFSNDTVFTYWLTLATAATATDPAFYNLRRTGASGDVAAGTIIANDITLLSFVRNGNRVTVVLEARAASGPRGQRSREHLETIASMRSRSANLP